MRVLFLRHGLTSGNLSKRYVGTTDEPLCSAGIAQLQKLEHLRCEVLVSSPMMRCIQTAKLLFPGQKTVIVADLRECDFGDFDGKNYIELSGSADYQKWIDSGGKLPFPNGESTENFKNRCIAAFERTVSTFQVADSIAFVVHGGTIMSVLEKYAVPHRDYYDWHCENGHGYVCEWNGSELNLMEII